MGVWCRPGYNRWTMGWKLLLTGEISLNSRYKRIHYKYIMRIYYTPDILCKFGLNVSEECSSCRGATATFHHLVWLCPAVSSFWEKLIHELNTITEMTLQPGPLEWLLGIIPEATASTVTFWNLGLVLARWRIAMRWRSDPLPPPPNFTSWLRDLVFCSDVEDTVILLVHPQQ